MARIGVKNFRFSLLDENDEVIEPQSLGKAINCSVSLNNNSATLYADDSLAESDNTFNNGTVSIGVDDDDDKTLAPLLGHKITEDGEIIRTDKDIAPYIAFGRIITKMVNGAYKYKVEWLAKVKLNDALPEETTKGESTEFATPSYEGSVLRNKNGVWSKSKTFASYEEASEYLDSLLTAPTKTVNASTPSNTETSSAKSGTTKVN